MKTTIELPWYRYGLIAELSCRLYKKSPQFGKTALEKVVYLLQELCGIQTGYEFGLHTYGPFSPSLLSDLDCLETLGGVEIRYVLSATGGYSISPGENCESIRGRAKPFLTKADSAIGRIVDEFGRFSAKDLELRSTIVYVHRDAHHAGQALSRDGLVRLVHQIKPHFSEMTIEDALLELEMRGYVGLPA